MASQEKNKYRLVLGAKGLVFGKVAGKIIGLEEI